jgi:hypothetical protein
MRLLKVHADLAIDPGFRALGWCLWTGKMMDPAKAGVITSTKRDKFDSMKFLLEKLSDVPEVHCARRLLCEYPTYFTSLRGQACLYRGDLVALAMVVGCIAEWGWSRGMTVHLVSPNTWKGTLPKAVVNRRIEAAVDTTVLSPRFSHDWDACGIGLYFRGHGAFN